MSDHDEELARLRAEMDQSKQGLREVAGGSWTFYSALIEQGFQEHQALTITVAWITALTTKQGDVE